MITNCFSSDHSIISAFHIDGEVDRNNVTKDEGDKVLFHCTVSSKPVSLVTLFKNGNEKATSNTGNRISFQIQQSKCEDAGLYSCTGVNRYSTGPATAYLWYSVRCEFGFSEIFF